MTAYRKNHQVTRGYLANWSCIHNGSRCIWYIDVESQTIRFSQGEAAGFAVSDWLYVPELAAGTRNPALENWFGIYEKELCQLARLSKYGRPSQIFSADFEEKAIKGCINLGFRSKYKVFKTMEHIRKNRPDFTEERIIVASLQMLYNGMISLFEILKNSVFTIIYNLPVKLLSEETPFHTNMLQSGKILSVAMALSPTALLFGLPINDAPKNRNLLTGFRLNWLDGSSIVEASSIYNRSSILGARQWLVCSSKQEADFVIHEFSKEKLAKRTSKDVVGILRPLPSCTYTSLYGEI